MNRRRFGSYFRQEFLFFSILLFSCGLNLNAQEKYKYVVGENPDEFKKLLNEFGNQKYKLLSATKIPLKDNEHSYTQMILAAILKYDGEQTFSYEYFAASNPDSAEFGLNALAEKGFRYRKTFWFTDGIKDPAGCSGDDATSQILCRGAQSDDIRVGSLVLMEQEDGKNNKSYYKVLSGDTKAFIWEKSNAATLREVFSETLKDSFFLPLGLFYYQLDFRDAVIVEIINDAEIVPKVSSKISYKIVRNELGGSFNKEIERLGGDGFQIIAKEKNFAVVGQNEENKTPVSYEIVAAHKKNHLAEINKLAAQEGARFLLADYDHYEIDQFEGKLLFEKKVKTGAKRFTYKAVKLTDRPLYPNKQVKKRTVQPASAAAMNELNELVKNGYEIRALYYSRGLGGIAALFEKER